MKAPTSANLACCALLQAKQDTSELEVKGKAIKERIAACEENLRQLETARDAALAPIGNLVHDTVPIDNDEVR